VNSSKKQPEVMAQVKITLRFDEKFHGFAFAFRVSMAHALLRQGYTGKGFDGWRGAFTVAHNGQLYPH